MKKIALFLLALFPVVAYGQTVIPTGSAKQLTYQRGGYGADSVLAIPFADTSGAGATWTSYRKVGRIMVNDNDSTLYYHDGKKWRKVLDEKSQDTFFVRNQMRYAQEANSWINGVTTTKNAIVYGDNGAGLDSATLAAMAESAA